MHVKHDHIMAYGHEKRSNLGFMFLFATVLLCLLLTQNPVFAAQQNETLGPQGYGWQQVFITTPSTTIGRLTGSADRQYYDWGFKNIQIYSRVEDYWAEDSGWWYVGGGNTTGVRIIDAAGDVVYANYSQMPYQGRVIWTYDWGTDDDPGEWTVIVNSSLTDGTTYATAVFKLYVRGQLKPSISTSGNTAGSPVTISVSLTDNAGNTINGSATDNAGNSVAPTDVKAYVEGPGEKFVVTLTDPDNDGTWTGSFTPSNVGDYKIKVKAGDGHRYWVDGSASTTLSVTGRFPPAMAMMMQLAGGFLGAMSSLFAIAFIYSIIYRRLGR